MLGVFFEGDLGFGLARCGLGKPRVERTFAGRRDVRGVINKDQSGERLAEGDSMMRSQIMASEGGRVGFVDVEVEVEDGYSAATQRNSCFVFQVKSEVRSASRSNLMIAYSARLGE